jgi:hypothetical protein
MLSSLMWLFSSFFPANQVLYDSTLVTWHNQTTIFPVRYFCVSACFVRPIQSPPWLMASGHHHEIYALVGQMTGKHWLLVNNLIQLQNFIKDLSSWKLGVYVFFSCKVLAWARDSLLNPSMISDALDFLPEATWIQYLAGNDFVR